jgi:hypothetical protein
MLVVMFLNILLKFSLKFILLTLSLTLTLFVNDGSDVKDSKLNVVPINTIININNSITINNFVYLLIPKNNVNIIDKIIKNVKNNGNIIYGILLFKTL